MSKIRLLVDAHVFDGEFQGSRTFIENVYKNLVSKYSDRIDFYFTAYDTSSVKSIFGDGANYVKLESSNKFSRLLFEFPRIIKQNNIDWAHFQYITPPFKSCKYIVTCHDVLFERYPEYFPFSYRLSKHFLFKRSAQKSDLLTTVSEYSKNEIAHFYNINKENIHITHNGVHYDPNSVKPDFDGPYILFVSRIEPRKNHHLLLKAMINLNLFEEGYKLIVVGKESISNKEFNTLKSETLKKFPACITVLENISEAEKNGLIDNCSLFVYPSSAEGFGIPPLEAALRKVPVVCSNKTSMKEFDFFGAGHINPEDQNELETAISGIISGNLKTDLDAIAKLIQEKYNWGKSADVIADQILNSKS